MRCGPSNEIVEMVGALFFERRARVENFDHARVGVASGDVAPGPRALALGIGLDAQLVPDRERREGVAVAGDGFGQRSVQHVAQRLVEREGGFDAIGDLVFAASALGETCGVLGKLLDPVPVAIGGTAFEQGQEPRHGLGRHATDERGEQLAEVGYLHGGHDRTIDRRPAGREAGLAFSSVGWDVVPVTGVLGAEVRGLDLADIGDDELAELRALLCDREVLVIRDQRLTAESQSRFSRRLGPSAETPFVATMTEQPDVIRVVKEADEGAAFNFGGAWHSDFSFQSAPPSFTILAAVDVPRWGGDTVFASMTAAWSALDRTWQDRLAALSAVHTARDAYSPRLQPLHSGMRGMSIVCDDSANDVHCHPLVTVHPETGRTALFFNRAYVRDIDGLDHADAVEIMNFLHAHTTDARFTYRHRWLPGDVVAWDNRSTQHLAVNDYGGFRRELHRTTVAGTRPVALAR